MEQYTRGKGVSMELQCKQASIGSCWLNFGLIHQIYTLSQEIKIRTKRAITGLVPLNCPVY